MAENNEGTPDVTVEDVIQKNKELATVAENLKAVLTEMQDINSQKELKIAELQATVKRFSAIIEAFKAQAAAQGQEAPVIAEEESAEAAEEEVAEDE